MSADNGWSSSVTGPVKMRHRDQEATASGIYGVIVSAAVMSASHAEKAYQVTVAVVVTLTIYWGAERYARIVAERIHEGHRPSWTTVRHQLTHGWEMVTASALPLLTLAVMTLLGAQLSTAVFGALICSTVLLCVAGWAIGRGGRLSARERIASTLVAGMFGALFVLLKAFLHGARVGPPVSRVSSGAGSGTLVPRGPPRRQCRELLPARRETPAARRHLPGG